jgi:hypothetical protein
MGEERGKRFDQPRAPGGRRGVARNRISANRSSQGEPTRWRKTRVVRRHQRRGGPPSLHARSSSLGARQGELGTPPRLLLPDLQAQPIVLAAIRHPLGRLREHAPADVRGERSKRLDDDDERADRWILEPAFDVLDLGRLLIRWGPLLPQPALLEVSHSGLVRGGVTARRRGVIVVAVGEAPEPGSSPSSPIRSKT